MVWGLGVSGLSAVEYCLKAGGRVWAVNQGPVESWASREQLERWKKQFGEQLQLCSQEHFPQAEISAIQEIILSPGLARESAFLRPWHELNVPIINEIELAHRQWRAERRGPILAITGSNGKTTTTLLTAHLLKEMGLQVFAGGNLGTPFCEVFNRGLKPDVAVLELSSFQLESLFEFRAEAGILLNLSFTHGERYKDLVSYGQAKLRLGRNQTQADVFLLPTLESQRDPVVVDLFQKAYQESQVRPYRFDRAELEQILDLQDYQLIGGHNLSNLAAACALMKHCFPKLMKDKLDRHALKNFQAPAHRLEPVANKLGRLIINDSKSTNWDATMSAIKALGDRPVALILGGQKRGGNDSIAPYLSFFENALVSLALVGEVGREIEAELKQKGSLPFSFERFDQLEDALKWLVAQSDQAILFSPAFPSFDQFRHYEHRGECFKEAVKKLL